MHELHKTPLKVFPDLYEVFNLIQSPRSNTNMCVFTYLKH